MWDDVGEEADVSGYERKFLRALQVAGADDEEEFFEFSLHVEPLTEEVALIITDFVDADEEGDAIELWNKQVEMLHRTVGG